jgi:hypothetical protein
MPIPIPIPLIRAFLVSTFLGMALGGAGVAAADTCTDFKWDVTKERALFAAPSTPLAAGPSLKSAPLIVPNRLYELHLSAQNQVTFAAAPGKETAAEGAYAGIVQLKLPAAGSYRVAIDAPYWIDVVSDGALLVAQDYQGQRGCAAPHKIVEFFFAASGTFALQLSGATAEFVLLSVTPVAARKY